MRSTLVLVTLGFLLNADLRAQDLVISNARIIDGTGRTIDSGSIVISDGRILAVNESGVAVSTAASIDAQGMTVMPGLIDTHVHLLTTASTGATNDEELEQYMSGSGMPADLPNPIEWRFDQPQPAWGPVTSRNPEIESATVTRSTDALRITLAEGTLAPDGRYRGGLVVEVPARIRDWDFLDVRNWGRIVVRARTSDPVRSIFVGFNLGERSDTVLHPSFPFEVGFGDWVIPDGEVHEYQLSAPDFPSGWEAWRELGLGIRSEEPASIDILSVRIVPVEAKLQHCLQRILAAGFTTVMSTGDFHPAILEVRRRLDAGQLQGPRLLAVGSTFTAPGGHPASTVCSSQAWCRARGPIEVDDPEAARAWVRELATAGVDAIKAVYDAGRGGNRPRLDDDVLAAIAAEARRVDLPLIVHAGSVEETLKAVELGASRFVHLRGWNSSVNQILGEAGIPVSSTIWRRRYPPDFQAAVDNVRPLWDQGVVIAFGTDRGGVPPAENLLLEARTLAQTLSTEEIITSLTRNAAAYLDLSDEIGTLEPGKLADIVIIDGDPLADLSHLANVVVVIKGGEVVVDNR